MFIWQLIRYWGRDTRSWYEEFKTWPVRQKAVPIFWLVGLSLFAWMALSTFINSLRVQ